MTIGARASSTRPRRSRCRRLAARQDLLQAVVQILSSELGLREVIGELVLLATATLCAYAANAGRPANGAENAPPLRFKMPRVSEMAPHTPRTLGAPWQSRGTPRYPTAA